MNKAESKYFKTATKMNESLLELLHHKDFEYITVKEICELAGVNRSTFYLHYESLNDLLIETGEYINNKFFSYFKGTEAEFVDINNSTNEELNFIKPLYLNPWLTFIKDNKKLFQTVIKHFHTLALLTAYKGISTKIVKPILERLIPSKEDRHYILEFYVEGIMAIVRKWIDDDCNREIEQIIELIVGCVNR